MVVPDAYLFSFTGINIFDISPSGIKVWKQAMSKYESALNKIDGEIVAILQSAIMKQSNSTRQILNTFKKFKALFARDSIKKAIYYEREQLLLALPGMFRELRENLTQTQCIKGDYSPLVVELKWLSMVEAHLKEIFEICEDTLDDIPNYQTTLDGLKEFMEETKALLRLSYQKWCESSLDAIFTKELM